MWEKIKISEIRQDALKSLSLDYNGNRNNKWILRLYYYMIPLVISLIVVIIGARIDDQVANYFITGISIFAGLFFNLLLVVADKLNVKKRLLETDDNIETIEYIKRYRNFSEQLISQISYTIIISIFLIMLMFLTHVENWLNTIQILQEFKYFELLRSFFDVFIFYVGVKFIVLLSVILSSMYIMLLDDMKIQKGN